MKWFRESLGAIESPLYLCDHELIGSQLTGLDLIERMGIASEAVLVTHRADELEIRERCLRSGVRLLPKAFVELIPINVR